MVNSLSKRSASHISSAELKLHLLWHTQTYVVIYVTTDTTVVATTILLVLVARTFFMDALKLAPLSVNNSFSKRIHSADL